MRIGILTFHRALNYGAVLQAYALSETLSRNEDIQAEIIDYRCKYIEDCYKPLVIVGGINIKNAIIAILTMRSRIVRRKKFDHFLNNALKKSENHYSRAELAGINDVYDCFITGSDQVFNDVCTGMDKSYFLDFVANSEKKFSYAASFGFEQIPSQYRDLYKQLLSDFEDISVREEAGRGIVRDLLGREVRVNIDPVFLLGREDWKKIAKKPKENNYILLYLLQPSESIIQFAKNLSRKTGCKILLMHLHFFKPNGIKQITNAGPEEFLGYFENASYVVTNSFHGTAFSVIFHKQFFVEYQTTAAARNSRQQNLLKMLGLTDRVITIETEKELLLNADDPIDFDAAFQRIKMEQKCSEEYLREL